MPTGGTFLIMPRSSWGTKTKIDKNKWRIRWCEWDGLNRVRRSKTLYPCTSREADDELRRLWQLHHLPPNERVVPCPTFSECWYEWYLPELNTRVEKGELADNTRKVYVNQWTYHIEKRWEKVMLDKVDVNEYQLWIKTMKPSAAKLSNITVGNLVTCAKLHGVKGITFKDVQYKMPRNDKAPNSELEVYTLPELHQLMKEIKGKRYESVVMLMGIGSCRVAEALAAGVDDITFEQYNGRTYAVYDLHQQYGLCKQGFMVLKTKDSYRPIIIPEPWSLRLAEIVDERKREGERYLADRGTGYPYDRPAINQLWRNDFKDGSISVRFLPMQKLRNTWATAMLWKYNVPAQMVDKMMGHAAKNILGKNYDRPDKQMFIETVDKVYFGN